MRAISAAAPSTARWPTAAIKCAYTSAVIAIEEWPSSFDAVLMSAARQHQTGRKVPQAVERQLRQRLTPRLNLLELAADVARVERPAVFHREHVTVAPSVTSPSCPEEQ